MLYVGTMLNKLQKLCSSLNFWQFAVFYLFGLLHSKFTTLCLGKNPLRIRSLVITVPVMLRLFALNYVAGHVPKDSTAVLGDVPRAVIQQPHEEWKRPLHGTDISLKGKYLR